MELPIELWNAIAYNLKFELGLYKNVSLVNKHFCIIVRKIYDRIPNQLCINTSADFILPSKLITYEHISCLENAKCHRIVTVTVNRSFTINKNHLLNRNMYAIYYNNENKYYPQHGTFQLKPQNFLDYKLDQMCYDIVFMPCTNGFFICYHTGKS